MASPPRDPRLLGRQNSGKRFASDLPQGGQPSQSKLAKRDNLNFSSRSDGLTDEATTGTASTSVQGSAQAAPNDNSVYDALLEFSNQNAILASFQTGLDQAKAQLKRAQNEYEASLHSRFKSFAAIREQKEAIRVKAEKKVAQLENALEQHKTSQQKITRKVADLLSSQRAVTQPPRDDAQIHELLQKVEQVRAEVRSISQVDNDHLQTIKTRLDKIEDQAQKTAKGFEKHEQSYESQIQAYLGRVIALERTKDKPSPEVLQRFEHFESSRQSNDAEVGDLKARVAEIERSGGNTKEDSKALHEGLAQLKLDSASAHNDLHSRVERIEAERSLFALQTSLTDLSTAVQSIQNALKLIRDQQASKEKTLAGETSRTSTYGLLPFAPVTSTISMQTSSSQMNGGPIPREGAITEDQLGFINAELEQLKAGLRSHRQRLDNVSTDQVVRAMIDQMQVLYPHARQAEEVYSRYTRELNEVRQANTQLRDQTQRLTATMNEVRGQMNDLVTRADTSYGAVSQMDPKITKLFEIASTHTQQLDSLQKEVQHAHSETAEKVKKIGEVLARQEASVQVLAKRIAHEDEEV